LFRAEALTSRPYFITPGKIYQLHFQIILKRTKRPAFMPGGFFTFSAEPPA